MQLEGSSSNIELGYVTILYICATHFVGRILAFVFSCIVISVGFIRRIPLVDLGVSLITFDSLKTLQQSLSELPEVFSSI